MKCATAAAALALVLTGATASDASPATATGSVRFSQVFSTRAAPPAVRFRASYQDEAGRSHVLTQWREGDRRLRRDTDDAISVFVAKESSGEYGYRVVDRKRGVQVEVSRTNLYRIGVFSDFPSLATNLNPPTAPHTLTKSARAPLKTSFGTCRFYRLETPGAAAREICWSAKWALPLVIERDTGNGTWRRDFVIEEVSTAIDAGVFAAPQDRYFEVNANRDIGGDD